MKRFIRYLYEYEQGKRIRNVGFVKVETGNEETVVHLQGKGFHSRGQELGLYLFFEEKGRWMRIWHEDIKLVATALSYHLIYRSIDEKLKDVYGKIKGILLDGGNGRLVAATWDDNEIDVGQMEEYGGPQARESEKVGPRQELDGPESEYGGPQAREDEEVAQEKSQVTKISRQEISRLPRCEWQLANNKFLIHGYQNYHHLLLIERENDLKLGVPGIYHINEAKCAECFGFEEFVSAEEFEDISNDQDHNDDEIFGYWCRLVRRR